MNNNLKKPLKIPPDKNNPFENHSIPIPMEISTKKPKKITSNLETILLLLDMEIQQEKDEEIVTILVNQEKILQKILIQKQTGKKHNFKSAENIAISQLQKQVLNLEKVIDEKLTTILKSVDEKFATTLKSVEKSVEKSIENNQIIAKTHAQIASQKQEKNQKIPKQNPEIKTNSIVKKIQKEDQENNKTRRVILHIKPEIWKNFNSFQLRNQINNAFLQKENID